MMFQQDVKVWTIRELMKRAIDYLQNRGIAEARLTVELLLAHALQCQRIELYTNFEKPVSREELLTFRTLFRRRLNHEPVQYLVGSTMFMGMKFLVDRRVLIPRPETETLVEQAVLLGHRKPEGRILSVLEIGTGSGNVAVGIAKLLKNAVVTSIEKDKDALELARLNVLGNGVEERVLLQHLDIYEPIDQLLRRRFDLLVSNPPYVSSSEWSRLEPEVRLFEPKDALCDGADGFEFHRRILEIGPYLLNDGGSVLLEVGADQASTVRAMMENARYADMQVVCDLQGVERVVIGTCAARVRNEVPIN